LERLWQKMEIANLLIDTPLDDEMCGSSLHPANFFFANPLLFSHNRPAAQKQVQNEEEPTANLSYPQCASPAISSEIIFGSPQASNDKDSLLAGYKLLSEDDKSDEIHVKEQLYTFAGVDVESILRQQLLEENGKEEEIVLPSNFGNDNFNFEETKTKYHVLEKVGEGTFSSVYKAICKATQRVVVLKRIYPTCSPDRILNEMKYLHLLGGKANVLPLLGALRCRDQVSLVLPYFEHHKFKDYLPLMTVPQIRSYMRALFVALEHVHANRIIHRDVKPGNFLFNPDTQTFVLVDFGLAQTAEVVIEPTVPKRGRSFALPTISPEPPTFKRKRDDSLDQYQQSPKRRYAGQGRAVAIPSPVQAVVRRSLRAPRGGTRGFRAPEVLLKCHNQTVAIDIWSAGVILLCILSTRYPFFTAPDDLVSLAEIASLFGTQELREVALKLNRIIRFPSDPREIPKTPLKDICNKLTSRTERMPESVFNLLEHCLDLNPATRITAKEALKHPFFQ